MLLREGDVIAAKGNGYGLIIPSYANPYVQSLCEEAKAFAGIVTGEEKALRISKYVGMAIESDKNWGKDMHTIHLEDSLQKRQGVCKEKAAALCMVYILDGIPCEYKRGKRLGVPRNPNPSERHAWVKAFVDGKALLADPQRGTFGDYDEIAEYWGYIEDPENN